MRETAASTIRLEDKGLKLLTWFLEDNEGDLTAEQAIYKILKKFPDIEALEKGLLAYVNSNIGVANKSPNSPESEEKRAVVK